MHAIAQMGRVDHLPGSPVTLTLLFAAPKQGHTGHPAQHGSIGPASSPQTTTNATTGSRSQRHSGQGGGCGGGVVYIAGPGPAAAGFRMLSRYRPSGRFLQARPARRLRATPVRQSLKDTPLRYARTLAPGASCGTDSTRVVDGLAGGNQSAWWRCRIRAGLTAQPPGSRSSRIWN